MTGLRLHWSFPLAVCVSESFPNIRQSIHNCVSAAEKLLEGVLGVLVRRKTEFRGG